MSLGIFTRRGCSTIAAWGSHGSLRTRSSEVGPHRDSPKCVRVLHTTCMADSDAEVLGLLGSFEGGPLAGRELGHVTSPTTVLEENDAQQTRLGAAPADTALGR